MKFTVDTHVTISRRIRMGKEEVFRGKEEVKMTSRQRSYVILKETIPPYKVDTATK